MSRYQAVAFFLGDPAFLSDPKFRALARRLPEPDDFNAAVGAYWIALSASRRKGSPVVDAEAETASRFLVDLRAVGLLRDDGFPPESWAKWGAVSPQQAAAGRARAESALRDEGGHFLPRSQGAPAGPSALDKLASAVQPSPPLPSLSSSSLVSLPKQAEEVADSAEPERPVLVWLAEHGVALEPNGNGLHRNLVDLVRRRTSEAVIAAFGARVRRRELTRPTVPGEGSVGTGA